MPELGLEALRRRREEARKSLYLGAGDCRGKIVVHMGTCGIAAGSRGVLAALQEALRARGTTDISVITTGCAGLCSMEPMMTVQIADAAPVKYGRLDAEKTRKVFEQHVVGGRILVEYALGIGSERAG